MALSDCSSDNAQNLESKASSSHHPRSESGMHEISKVSTPVELSLFSKIAWWSLIVNLGVVAWGAYLRAMQYGDGCGSHWPLCDGDSKPLHGPIAKIVE